METEAKRRSRHCERYFNSSRSVAKIVRISDKKGDIGGCVPMESKREQYFDCCLSPVRL